MATDPVSDNTPMLRMTGICKSFATVPVLKQINLALNQGEVLALMGENGAGKSTLMKILCGIHQATEGSIHLDGGEIALTCISDAMKLGLILIHQELNLVDNLDVAGNLFLGREPRNGFGLLNKEKLYTDAKEILKLVDLDIDPATPISRLSLAQQQLVEIAKALSQNARVLIMDEPTSSLTLKETERLFEIIRQLKSKGVTVIYISHRLNEITEIADRALVLRDGENSGELAKKDINHENLIRLMIGRDIDPKTHRQEITTGNANTFQLKNVATYRYPGQEISLEVKSGEILGLSGLIGSGRTELAETIFGVRKPVKGQLIINGKEINITAPKDAIKQGIFLIPEDRKKQGVFLEMSVTENITLTDLSRYSKFSVINQKQEAETAKREVNGLHIKCPSINTPLKNLSGGNQQKVAIAKWLEMQPTLIIFDEPTRGVDVGAKGEIYQVMRKLAAEGIMVLVISSDMEEIIKISDKIAVMSEGKISGTLLPPDFSEENIMSLAVDFT